MALRDFRILLLVALTLLGSGNVLAEKIYKLVGADGKVSYTNQNPQLVAGTAQATPQEVEVKEAYSSTIHISYIGSTAFCGSIALPVRDVTSTTFYGQVVNSNKNWMSEIDRLNKSLAQYTSSYYSGSGAGGYTVENLKRLQELHCATEWADAQKKNAMQEKEQLLKKSAGLSQYLSELKAGATEICGQEPVYSPTDRLFPERRQTWNNCISGQNQKLTDIQSDLKRTDQLLLDIKHIEDTQ